MTSFSRTAMIGLLTFYTSVSIITYATQDKIKATEATKEYARSYVSHAR